MTSPNKRIELQVSMPSSGSLNLPHWSAKHRGQTILTDCNLSLDVLGEGNWLQGASILNTSDRSANDKVKVLFGRAESAQDHFNETRFALRTAGNRRIDVVFRCYDDAIAFRYEIPKQPGLAQVTIADEGTSFSPAGNPEVYAQYLENFRTSHEHLVSRSLLSELKPNTLLDMPLTLAYQNGTCLSITEAALRRYAGMSLMHQSGGSPGALVCKLAPRPDGNKVVRTLPMQTPWRVVMVANRLGALLESDTLYCLNEPSAIRDTAWIKPGKMTWAWWNGNVVKDGKPEPPIFSLEAQKLYIDFCAENGIPFHSTIADNTDTPWYFQTKQGIAPGPDTDVTRIRPDLDLKAIHSYAASKGVRLWTWVHQAALKGRVEEAFATFERYGWSGMMIDFFDHDDQETVEHAEAILEAAARHHILIHFHGIWKPTGLQRTYPNLMNHEGALNEEYLKWGNRCTPDHTLNLLFTRMVAGPMDYHLGGFRAVRRDQFAPHNAAPLVMGTRCFQLAAYVCMDNPNPMVADYPDAYAGQPGFDFLKLVPTWWDETRVIQAEMGKLVATARRKGETWYVGVMAAGEGREVEVPLTFLQKGRFSARIWKDGAGAEADPNKLETQELSVTAASTLNLRVSTDGGFVVQLRPVR